MNEQILVALTDDANGGPERTEDWEAAVECERRPRYYPKGPARHLVQWYYLGILRFPVRCEERSLGETVFPNICTSWSDLISDIERLKALLILRQVRHR
jgi:hypothetical protein